MFKSPEEVEQMIRERAALDSAIAEAQVQAKANAIQTIEDLVSQNGLTLDEVQKAAFPGKRGRKPKGDGAPVTKADPKYRDPADAMNTWTGRGRQPTWFKEAVAQGTDPATMLID